MPVVGISAVDAMLRHIWPSSLPVLLVDVVSVVLRKHLLMKADSPRKRAVNCRILPLVVSRPGLVILGHTSHIGNRHELGAVDGFSSFMSFNPCIRPTTPVVGTPWAETKLKLKL